MAVLISRGSTTRTRAGALAQLAAAEEHIGGDLCLSRAERPSSASDASLLAAATAITHAIQQVQVEQVEASHRDLQQVQESAVGWRAGTLTGDIATYSELVGRLCAGRERNTRLSRS